MNRGQGYNGSNHNSFLVGYPSHQGDNWAEFQNDGWPIDSGSDLPDYGVCRRSGDPRTMSIDGDGYLPTISGNFVEVDSFGFEPVNLPGRIYEYSQTDHQGCIKFPILNDMCSDRELKKLYPQENLRAFAAFVRDVHIVTAHHMDVIQRCGWEFVPSTCTHPAQLKPPFCIQRDFSSIVERFKLIRDFMVTSLALYGEGSGEQNAHSQSPNEAVPRDEQELKFLTGNWPTNSKKVFLSKLLVRHVGMKPTIHPALVEVADYCTGRHVKLDSGEILFHDGRNLILHRHDMYYMDAGMVTHPSIINTWAKVLNARDKVVGLTQKYCLNLVEKGSSEISQQSVIQSWMGWLHESQFDLKTAKLIFIPVRMGGHYFVVVVDFYKNVIHSIDSLFHRLEQPKWNELSALLAKFFAYMLHIIGDPRAGDVAKFIHKVVNPPWTTTLSDIDSGISVMHFMEGFYGELYVEREIHLKEVHNRLKLRITYCAAIVFSTANKQKSRVLGNIPRFIRQKCTEVISPSEDILQYRSIFNW